VGPVHKKKFPPTKKKTKREGERKKGRKKVSLMTGNSNKCSGHTNGKYWEDVIKNENPKRESGGRGENFNHGRHSKPAATMGSKGGGQLAVWKNA